MTDFRNLIQRLTDELDAAASNLYFDDYAPDIKSVLADARAYLTQPEPQGPTDDELDELFTEIDQRGESESWRSFARAVLARWGRPAIEPQQEADRG